MASPQPLAEPSSDYKTLLAQERSDSTLVFPSFTASTAFTLGTLLRNRILSLPDSQRNPAVISITAANSNQILFHALTESGPTPENENWVRRKRNTVLRSGLSSWALRRRLVEQQAQAAAAGGSSQAGDLDLEAFFSKKFALKSSNPSGVPDDYAVHGGGFPIRVANVDGIVGVVVVSGLKQEHDHQVIVEVIGNYLKGNH